jgi:hypothetical protein
MTHSAGVVRAIAVGFCVCAAAISFAQDRSFCSAVDNGTGTVELPPEGCAYLSPQEVHMIIDGLPPGTTIELDPIHHQFLCINSPCGQPGGSLGGQYEEFESYLTLELTGTGDLAGYERTLTVPIGCQTHTGPRTPGDPVQSFPTDMFNLLGGLTGDPDFTTLQITAGTNNGLPSPGQTTLTQRPDGSFSVDSFFDITYRIDFVGAPGSVLDGLAGSTTGTLRMEIEAPPEPPDPCVVPDDGTGKVQLPPEDCDYLSPQEVHMILDGLPPGTTIELKPIHRFFICETTPCGQPGGTLGGDVEVFDSTLDLQLNGTGELSGFRRKISLPVSCETHTGPRGITVPTKGAKAAPAQHIQTDMYFLQGALAGDPDFSSLTVTAGTGNGLPSPGQATITDLGDGTFMIDSFFDISYQIDFVGAPGSMLDGMSGSTQGAAGMTATYYEIFADGFESGNVSAWSWSVTSKSADQGAAK